MNVLAYLSRYQLDKLSETDLQLFTYFSYRYDIEYDQHKRPYFSLRLFTKINNLPILDFTMMNDGKTFYRCSICREKDLCHHFYVLVTYILLNEYQKLEKVSQRFVYEISDVERREQQDSFDEIIGDVFKNMYKEEIASTSTKAHLKISLEDTRRSYAINLSIGKHKQYKIASIEKFLSRFINEEEFKYGKDLTLVHNLASFDEISQKIIKILQKHQSRLFIDLNNVDSLQLLDELFDALKDDYLYIDDEVYHISSEEMPIVIHVNDDYSLNVQGIIPGYIALTNKYYICKSANDIKPISHNDYINQLVYSIKSYPLSNIEKQIDDFKYQFFEKYPKYFAFDEHIGDLLQHSSLKIKAYFDYEKDCIYVHSKYFKSEEEVPVSAIVNFHETSELNRYHNILSSYGFNEGVLNDPGLVWEFLNNSLEPLRKSAELYFSKDIESRKMRNFTPLKISVKKEGSLLDVLVDHSSYSEDELKAILAGLKRKKKFVKIGDDFINLSSEESKNFYDLVKDFDLLDNERLHSQKKVPLYYAFKAYGKDDNYLEIDSYLDNIFNELKDFAKQEKPSLKITGKLRNYQEEGIKWLSVLYKYNLGGILADDMGLGKTIETIGFIDLVKQDKPILIVSPKSLVFNWVSEFEKFAKHIPTFPIIGTAEERKKIIKKIKNDKFGVYFISYDSLRNEFENLSGITFDICILDEAQFIKNMHAKKTNAVKSINTLHSIALTGTPIENNIYDLWSIFDFLMPHYLLDYDEFRKCFEGDEQYYQIVKNKVAPFILRRRKEDVLKDLPEKYEVIFTTEMSEEQRKLYEAFRLKAKQQFKDSNGNSKMMEILSILTRLRQICVDPSTFVDNFVGESGKITALKEIIRNKRKEKHRFLIFSQFVSALNIVKEEIEKMGIKYFMITGETSAKDRLAICQKFNEDSQYEIVLISLKAGGTGLNLVGADVVIHLDPWWNYSAENQASDRAHRIGQTRSVEVIKLIAENSIEEKVVNLQNEKKELVDKVISNDDTSIKSLSIKDLKSILNM